MNTRLITSLRGLSAALMAASALAFAAPMPVAAANDAAPAACFYYRVSWGDTLTKIAIRYGVTINAIMAANGLRSTVIYAGTTLCIPVNTPAPPPSGGAWLAQFWNNTAQSGAPALERADSVLSFQWGFGTPNPAVIVADNFSARWTRSYNFIGGTYRFSLSADDGIRLWVDGNIVYDAYSFVGSLNKTLDVPITAGMHQIRVDYVEYGGLARVSASFIRLAGSTPPPPPPPPPQGAANWTASFYNNTTLSGAPVLIVGTGPIDFNWGTGSVGSGVQADNYTARFVTTYNFEAATYRFTAQVDDGIRMWVDDLLIFDQWREQSLRGYSIDIPMSAGTHNIRVEYLELTGISAVKVGWGKR
ncbi:MAG: LysM peptidoglycan-binding domain-containing protein [Thermoflexales bacterium]|nr:LysM peptidoglycan-binding domain-containing protein [Thermoflexales bacterium]